MDAFKDKFTEQLSKDADEGLSAPQKYLKSKYFYDPTGDLLFRRITRLPDYYLTSCETEILKFESKFILASFKTGKPLNIIELGSGDASKTKLLLDVADDLNLDVTYYPADISAEVLKLAKKKKGALVDVITVTGDYTEILETKHFLALRNKLILFLGSNIGNFSDSETTEFMHYLNKNINPKDHVLIGFDLVKDSQLILNAYNDATGLTSQFNLNLLVVLNRELGADFKTENFFHAPIYDEKIQAAKSFIVSNKNHVVNFKKLKKSFSFAKGESVFTEISSKYTVDGIKKLSKNAGFEVVSMHTDHRKYFMNVLMRKK